MMFVMVCFSCCYMLNFVQCLSLYDMRLWVLISINLPYVSVRACVSALQFLSTASLLWVFMLMSVMCVVLYLWMEFTLCLISYNKFWMAKCLIECFLYIYNVFPLLSWDIANFYLRYNKWSSPWKVNSVYLIRPSATHLYITIKTQHSYQLLGGTWRWTDWVTYILSEWLQMTFDPDQGLAKLVVFLLTFLALEKTQGL